MTSVGATKGDLKLYTTDGNILVNLSGTDPSVQHEYQMDPIVYPLPKEDSGSFDIAMYQDDTITISGDLAYNTISNPFISYMSIYRYCKYATGSTGQAHLYLVWNTTGYWCIPKSINFAQDAGHGDMLTYKFAFIRCGIPDGASELEP